MRLDPARFDVWFRALNGQEPFPWQRRLFRERLCPAPPVEACWPQWVKLPTASGKTALIDLAVLALAAGSPCARRRIAFVVDRRVVVDEAARRANSIAERLRAALNDPASPLHDVASALAGLGGGEPLLVATLRGGIPTDDRWARSPEQPCVLLSTVDQVGSRLLFRAYGDVGPRAWPIHAGLLGRDTLIVVDEAHCSRPFCQTLTSIVQKWQHFAETPVGLPLEAVFLSATPVEQAEFTLDDQDCAHPTLRERLQARKPVELVLAQGGRQGGRAGLLDAILNRVQATINAIRAGVVAVVINRVSDARTIYERLPLDRSRKLLLTGKVRPWERDRVLGRWLPLLLAGSETRPEGPVAVVATQAIEVGANFDFDFLITEIAPLDALRQRFGRLDRLGRRRERLGLLGGAELAAGAVVASSGQTARDRQGKPREPDPIYGEALCESWYWLEQHAEGNPPRIDFGIDFLEPSLPEGEELARLCQPAREAYRLLPAHLDLLAQTSPPPEPDPEISAFLHGAAESRADVTVVWRADLSTDQPEVWADRVAVQPPSTGEGCAVPIWEFRRWLSAPPTPDAFDSGDLESAVGGTESAEARARVLRWRGTSDAEVVSASEVRPGDVVVVPSSYGGCDELGWHPASTAPVLDIGDAVAFSAGRRPVLRLEALSGQIEGVDAACDLVKELHHIIEEEEDGDPAQCLEQLAGLESLPEWLRRLAGRLASDRRRRVVGTDKAFALVGSRSGGEDFSTAEESSLAAGPVDLADHCRGVRRWVERFAASLQLPETLASDLALAAWLHDVGKADPRFQAWLHGGDEIAASLTDRLLAKSPLPARDWVALRRARRLARYPENARHELESLALVSGVEALRRQASDWELVQHLIAAHHGFARPFVPVGIDAEPVAVELEHDGLRLTGTSDHRLHRLDSGPPERFWKLMRRYGWWGLAWLEAILRLADHRRSEEEEAGEVSHAGV